MTVQKTAISTHRYTCLSTDTKPTDLPPGSTIYETDTDRMFITYDGSNWVPKDLAWEVTRSPAQWYGLTSNTIARYAKAPIVITGGLEAWGTELQLHNGATIESGSSIKSMVIHRLLVSAIGTANRAVYLQFYQGTVGAEVACTFTLADDKVNKVAHGLADGTKLMIVGADIPAELNLFTVYYVVNKGNDAFEVSLTLGGAKIALSADKAGSYILVSQVSWAETIVAFAGTTPHEAVNLPTSVVLCNKRIWARGLCVTTATNAVSFYLGINTY